MTHFGILCPPFYGHLNPMAALGRELQQRGHRVTIFLIPDIESKVLAEGLEFWTIGKSDYPTGSLPQYLKQLGKLSGLPAIQHWSKDNERMAGVMCREAPSALKAAGVEVLLVDQMEVAGGTVAEFLGIPFITICNALATNWEVGVPPTYTPWVYQQTWWAHLRNRAAFLLAQRTHQPVIAILNEYRHQWQLPVFKSNTDYFPASVLAQISQQPASFDFPRQAPPGCFHYTGPFCESSPQMVPFPFERLTGQPLIYASLGTLVNLKRQIFHSIATACEGLDAQLVISLGAGSSVEDFQDLPGAPLVVEYAPQLELLKQAKMAITHAGLNTVLESLSNGVPLVAIPITFDQPGVAARVKWTGAGKVVPFARFSTSKLRTAVQQVLIQDSYSKSAAHLQETISQAGRVKRGADIVEKVAVTGQPILSSEFR